MERGEKYADRINRQNRGNKIPLKLLMKSVSTLLDCLAALQNRKHEFQLPIAVNEKDEKKKRITYKIDFQPI